MLHMVRHPLHTSRAGRRASTTDCLIVLWINEQAYARNREEGTNWADINNTPVAARRLTGGTFNESRLDSQKVYIRLGAPEAMTSARMPLSHSAA